MRIRLDHIVKIFGTLRANDEISATLEEGRIYAILGENGAGKSTLMKILSGYQAAESGTIFLDEHPVHFAGPADALQAGIGMLHQDPLDVATLTALENYILGRPSGLIPNRKAARAEFVKRSAGLGFVLNPDAYIDSLTIGERQQLEIMRLLSLGARVLILDEPTTGISTEQKDALFNSLKTLAKTEKLTVVLVSHKLEDVEALCDAVLVLRAGKVVGEATMPCPAQELVRMMFGQELPRRAKQRMNHATVALQVEKLSVQGRRLTLNGVNLEVKSGEVIGLAGLDGSGQNEFLRALAGLERPQQGRIFLGGRDVTSLSFHDRAAAGTAFAPAGRLEEGLVQGLTLAEHFALATANVLRIDWNVVQRHTEAQIARFNIRGTAHQQIQMLSGGNQQRVLLALLAAQLKLLLLEDPTRGLDVESTAWVWSQLLARRQDGAAILFTSPDLDEIRDYSDRILVFFGGEVTVIDDPAATNVTQLGSLIGGKQVASA
jgi:simple sugar transport system ATP-binding protein